MSTKRDRKIIASLVESETQTKIAHYQAHWHIFVPTLVISFLYASGWLFLFLLGRDGGAIARLFIVVLAIGVPLLFAHAFLRFQTISIEIYPDYVEYHTGWPRADPVKLPLNLITRVRFTQGLSGRLFGGGSVVIVPVAGDIIGIADVANPLEAVENIKKAKDAFV